MLELYQFQHSTFCLKVRMALKAKKLTFKVIEITPGIEQIDLVKLSGQKKVPVLKNGEHVVSDSSKIIQYLETINKEPVLLPNDPKEAALAHAIEEWSDTTLAKATRLELIKAATLNPSLRHALLPEDLPKSVKSIFNKIPYGFINNLTEIFEQGKSNELLTSLEKFAHLVNTNEWLIGDSLSIADIALASQLSLLRFPVSSGENLSGKGCPGFADNPNLEVLFSWRDELEKKIMNPDPSI